MNGREEEEVEKEIYRIEFEQLYYKAVTQANKRLRDESSTI